MKRRAVVFIVAILAAMLLLSFTLTWISTSEENPRLQRAARYLELNFNSELGLVRESPDDLDLEKHETYWLASDNLLAWKALELFPEHRGLAETIAQRLKKDYNIEQYDLLHDVLTGDSDLSAVDCGLKEVVLEENGYMVKIHVVDRSVKMEDACEYADRLCYKALALASNNRVEEAREVFSQALAMWDGVGLEDKAYREAGLYETYKLALLYYTAKKLGMLDKLEFKDELLNVIFSMQDQENGGFHTTYNGQMEQVGSTNSETTSLVILALKS